MASPQIEDGFVKVANEIMEALARIRIPGEARQVLDAILRKTYGFNKKQDVISLSQFKLATNLKKSTICKAIRKLKDLNLITQKGNGIANIYKFNKDFDTWNPLPKKITVTKKGNKSLPKKGTTKDIYTKDKGHRKTDPRIKPLIDYFSNTVLQVKGFEPQINFEKAATIIKQRLADYSEDEIRNNFKFYINSDKAKKCGITISAALSEHSINLYKQNWEKTKELYV